MNRDLLEQQMADLPLYTYFYIRPEQQIGRAHV